MMVSSMGGWQSMRFLFCGMLIVGVARGEEDKKREESKKKVRAQVAAQMVWIGEDGKVHKSEVDGAEGVWVMEEMPGDAKAKVFVLRKGGNQQRDPVASLSVLGELTDILPPRDGLVKIIGEDGELLEFVWDDAEQVPAEVRLHVEKASRHLSEEARARVMAKVEAALARVADQRRVVARFEADEDRDRPSQASIERLSGKLDRLFERLDDLEEQVQELRDRVDD